MDENIYGLIQYTAMFFYCTTFCANFSFNCVIYIRAFLFKVDVSMAGNNTSCYYRYYINFNIHDSHGHLTSIGLIYLLAIRMEESYPNSKGPAWRITQGCITRSIKV